jgi:hypothetical protein
MGQHYTKNTVETSYWCHRCHSMTAHRVLGGKLAGCIPCSLRPTPPPREVKQRETSGLLFQPGETPKSSN